MLFVLRVHTVDKPLNYAEAVVRSPQEEEPIPSTSSSTAAALQARNPNSSISKHSVLVIKGIVHLYRPSVTAVSFSSTSSSVDSFLPASRSILLYVLAVPGQLSADDFIHFCWPHVNRASDVRIIKNDATENRYSVLVKFDEQINADNFYLNINGWPFSPAEAEVCHILFLNSVDYTASTEIAGTPPAGYTELPTCPVCLERLDQDVSGIAATTCDHSFQCSCVAKWVTSSCSVCQFCQEHSEKPICSVCWTSENLWSCVICGFVGCGRYKEGHAFRHWKETQHCYSLDLETQRIWDYVGDTYVHRLNQSRSDGKSVKMKSQCRAPGDHFESCQCNDEYGISGALFSSKVEAIVNEYNHLLTSQLENQRQYYESLLLEAKDKREKHISEAVEKALSLKLKEAQASLETILKEKKNIADMNEKLMKRQCFWREKIKELEEREQATLKIKDEQIQDLEEQIRDFTVYLEAQKTIHNMGDPDDIRDGTVLPVQAPPSGTSRSRRSSRNSRRRH